MRFHKFEAVPDSSLDDLSRAKIIIKNLKIESLRGLEVTTSINNEKGAYYSFVKQIDGQDNKIGLDETQVNTIIENINEKFKQLGLNCVAEIYKTTNKITFGEDLESDVAYGITLIENTTSK